jgi:hypothetical protein
MNADDMIPVVVIGGVIVLVGGIIWLAIWLEKKRTEAVTAFAASNGFSPDPDMAGFQGSMAPYKLFNQGHGRKVKNLIRATRGDDQLAICDYQYTTGAGKNQQTHHHTICVVQSPRLRVPHFFARRQMAFFDFLGKVFGGQDINFDEDPTFSKAYVLQTGDAEDELRRCFNDRVRGLFSELAKKNPQVEGREGTVLFHYGRRLKPDRMNELIDDTLSIRQVLS